jgi:hypothetical protein
VALLKVKRSEAASTGGAQATVYAAVAADNVEALEMILPPTVAAYVGLVNAHLCAGNNHLHPMDQHNLNVYSK